MSAITTDIGMAGGGRAWCAAEIAPVCWVSDGNPRLAQRNADSQLTCDNGAICRFTAFARFQMKSTA
jgi:hypothetical protein